MVSGADHGRSRRLVSAAGSVDPCARCSEDDADRQGTDFIDLVRFFKTLWVLNP